jgi:hypothetical protein
MTFPLRISVQSRECSTALMERLGATLFPERPVGAAIVSALHRPHGSVICVVAPAMIDADDQIEYYIRLGMATTAVTDPRPPRERVRVLSIDDRSSRWLSEKLMDPGNPEAAEVRAQLRSAVDDEHRAGRAVLLTYFEPSQLLEGLAEELGVANDQAPAWTIPLGTKAAGRAMFRSLGIPTAEGTPIVRDLGELAAAIAPMVHAGHRRFVLKLDSTEYSAGAGNALLDVDEETAGAADLLAAVLSSLPRARLIDPRLSWSGFSEAVHRSGVLAEELLSGEEFSSPSVQGCLTADGPRIVSTHEQVLAANRQTFTGCRLGANDVYREVIEEYCLRVGEALHDKGVRQGDYAVDFIAIRRDGRWQVFGCELNLRATGTRHGYDMATVLLGVTPDDRGEVHVNGEPRVYLTSDSIISERLVGLRPGALIAAVEQSPLHYRPDRRQGVVLHLLSTLPTLGKFGAVCIAESHEAAERMLTELRALALHLGDSPVPHRMSDATR